MKNNIIFENDLIKIEIEPFEIPWLKIFTQQNIKEFSQCDQEIKMSILETLDIIEKEMLSYFKPDKINIASFGNYVPRVHFHIQARFKNDSFYPESIWGIEQRQNTLTLPNFDIFYNNIKLRLNKI
ncbi:Diadenosine tetraphosphate (Ap4A) hydrolase and other HIT family hydrolases [hydrothermal vent metagenome]|uniref:Diadenosine tetraphosphate (Ap4A) hydrolase and other HIT family hydrolases n=1 Tax=hydrothermal vent metagenome TaxID=652676 RepID=A0A3B1DT55_9ZZZZ